MKHKILIIILNYQVIFSHFLINGENS